MITKSCPQPAKKQYRVHNLPKSKSGTTTLRKPEPRYVSTNRKRDLRFPERDDPGSRKSLKSRLFSLLLCISCQQNYGLDVYIFVQTINLPPDSYIYSIGRAIRFSLRYVFLSIRQRITPMPLFFSGILSKT